MRWNRPASGATYGPGQGWCEGLNEMVTILIGCLSLVKEKIKHSCYEGVRVYNFC